MSHHCLAVLAVLLALAGCASPPPIEPLSTTSPPPTVPIAVPAAPPVADSQLRATIVPGSGGVVTRPAARPPSPGDVTLNFPGADVRAVAQSVLGDILRLPFVVDPDAQGQVTLVTATPVARGAVFALFEDALRGANLAITPVDGVYTIRSTDAARASAVLGGAAAAGFVTETIRLEFVNAEEVRKLLDPVVPGVISRVDPTANTIIIAGTSGQRASVRDLLRQFDVNWLRNMSFGLFVPQRTDSRLIVPELDKLLNASDAPTRGLVRLIAMERLNGILAITAQRQYLEDVRRWIEILDREGQNNERRLFVYRVQNGRAKDLARVLNTAFGNISGDSGGDAEPAEAFGFDTAARAGNTSLSTARDQARDNPRDPRNAVTAPGVSRAPAVGRGAGAAPVPIRANISSDDSNNAVIVFGTPRDFALVEDAMRKLDVLPYQVLIEAAITEVTLNNELRYGVEWNFQAGDTNFALTGPPNATGVPQRLFPGFSFFFSNSDITATLNALESRTKINVISAPKLMVLNNQTAALQVGNQVPVSIQSAVGVVNPDSPIVNSIEYRDTGVILKVTPRVNAGGLVLLDIAQEVSDVVQTNTSTIDSPTISTRRISTSIAVQDGQTIALGGLITDNRSAGKSGLPLLSRIPLIGGLLFGRTNDTQNRTELLVLLKPRVVRTIDDGRAITEELRGKIRSIAPIRGMSDLP